MKQFEKNQCVDINQLKDTFPTVNDHSLRSLVKFMGGREEDFDKKLFY